MSALVISFIIQDFFREHVIKAKTFPHGKDPRLRVFLRIIYLKNYPLSRTPVFKGDAPAVKIDSAQDTVSKQLEQRLSAEIRFNIKVVINLQGG